MVAYSSTAPFVPCRVSHVDAVVTDEVSFTAVPKKTEARISQAKPASPGQKSSAAITLTEDNGYRLCNFLHHPLSTLARAAAAIAEPPQAGSGANQCRPSGNFERA